jgi:prevent-host-death family protein
VITAGEDADSTVSDPVHEAMFLIDAPRPGTTQFALQRFGLADSGERLTLDFPNVNLAKDFFLLAWATLEPRDIFRARMGQILPRGLALTYGNAYADCMTSMNASEAREKLYRLLDETASDHEPVLITGPRSNAVLVGEEDWNSIQETLYLLSVPGMRESIAEGLATPVDRCEKEPGW